ncbi:sulfur oxidation c-type cytochrome SoxX [Roseivivax isoporae]|uniref:Monoheme cytochrome C SoxX n=1 Tax=Roseivivax isoporae LMG 25204 TaxID=1449351 RepID=X7F369_9RHOB|nr:sulfur oxidation c-type cytochrome SoxX [Roseivivax isoporae]ETX27255.1 monoheme cytochrome C SoxX [Roseivivax isoporae LMG 25204]
MTMFAKPVACAAFLIVSGLAPLHAQEVVAPSAVSFTDMGGIETSLTGTPGDVAAGAELMNKGSGNCIACHKVTALSDLPFHGEIGPPLDGVATRWDEAQLRGIVANAKKTFPGTIMPAFYHTGPYVRPGDAFTGDAAKGDVAPLLSAQDVENVVAYLMTLDTYPE